MQWEFKMIKFEIHRGIIDVSVNERKCEAEMNMLGKDGWELVSSFVTNDCDGMTNLVLMTFKREKQY